MKALISAGDVTRRADGAWHSRPLARVETPRTAVEAVRRRLSGLTVPARDVASIAAITGRRFDFEFLQTLTGHGERALLALMRELIAAQLVTEESSDRFAFRHALTRQAIVGELLARERATLHRAVADELERCGESSDTNYELIAYHAYGAMDWPRALAASSQAAEHALALQAPREALAHLDRAFQAAERASLATPASLRMLRGRALETLGDLQGAHDDFEAAWHSARHDTRETDAWESLHALGKLWAARDHERAGEYRREALTLARFIGDAALIARSLNRVANWHVNIDQPAPAIRDHAEALALFERSGDRQGVAETVDLLAMTHFVAGNLVQSAAMYERALQLHEEIGDARGIASALALSILCDGSNHASCTAFGASEIASRPDVVDRSIRLTKDIGWRAGEAFVRYLLGDVLSWRGEYDRALPLVRESLVIAQEMAHLQWECGASCALGLILLNLQNPALARAPLEQARAIALRLGSRTWTRWSSAPLAVALAQLGEFESARVLINDASIPASIGREALQPGDEDSPTLGERYLALASAELAHCEGNALRVLEIVDARLHWEQTQAGNHVTSDGATARGSVPRLTFLRARALLAIDRLEEAEQALMQARDEAAASGARAMLWRVHAALGDVHRKQRRRVESRLEYDAARRIAHEMAALVPDVALRETFLRAVNEIAPSSRAPTKLQKAKALFGGLTSREREVARLVAQGKANRAIARTLGIGERTVEGYVASALAKRGFPTRARLAAWTVEQGFDTSDAKH